MVVICPWGIHTEPAKISASLCFVDHSVLSDDFRKNILLGKLYRSIYKHRIRCVQLDPEVFLHLATHNVSRDLLVFFIFQELPDVFRSISAVLVRATGFLHLYAVDVIVKSSNRIRNCFTFAGINQDLASAFLQLRPTGTLLAHYTIFPIDIGLPGHRILFFGKLFQNSF